MTNAEKITKDFYDSLTAEEMNGIKKLGQFAAKWNNDLEWVYCELAAIEMSKG